MGRSGAGPTLTQGLFQAGRVPSAPPHTGSRQPRSRGDRCLVHLGTESLWEACEAGFQKGAEAQRSQRQEVEGGCSERSLASREASILYPAGCPCAYLLPCPGPSLPSIPLWAQVRLT